MFQLPNRTLQSSWIRLYAVASSKPTSIPSIRRDHCLLYVMWLMLDGDAMARAEPSMPTSCDVLEMGSIEEWLGASKLMLEGTTFILEKMIPPEKRKDGEAQRCYLAN
mmetsp:Transcript_36136/g.75945  ORF Transcript_36136/g.75945 Transcript_36136/m.75945 type:complete len:108 (-) Transcript_36136:387-710(-)